ncbi:MAG TPA: serine hydrolase [Solimonas sp.]|nr:serine hydrolase [Solimonas sp.]
MNIRADLRLGRNTRIPGFLAGLALAAASSFGPAISAEPTHVSFAPPAASPAAPTPALPADLAETPDQQVQQALNQSLQRLKLQDAVKAGHLAVSLVDITDVAHPQLAQVNGDRMLYAASLPKIAILLGVFAKADAGLLNLDDATIETCKQMIRRSSNTAASALLEKVSIPYLAKVLQSDRYKLYDSARNGGLWVGRPYASNGTQQQRDPMHGLSHGATAFQVARFYYLLETGQLVSPEASRHMKEIMGSPAIHHKFVAGLEKARPGAQLFRKSGTWRNFHADSAIIERAGHRYIAVALSDDAHGGDWFPDLIVALDDIVVAGPARQSL